jgi:C4-dicarboxylate transporter, DctM subunit
MVALLFAVVMGGLYLGVFSPTEGAGIGAFAAFLFALIRRRLSGKGFMDSLIESAKTSSMIFIIVIGAMVLVVFLAITKLPQELSGLITGLQVNRYLVIAAMMIIYIILGCFMEGLGMAMLTIPIFLPIVLALGFNPIWFGVLQVRVTEIGMITPPVGMNVFVIKAMAKDVSLSTVFKGIIPFFIADLFHLILLIAFPALSLLIPDLMFTK